MFATLILIQTPFAAGLPPAFDIRDIDGHSYIGPVRNQGDCGGCYAFGALAAAESTYNRANNLHGDDAIDFSEAFIVWGMSPLYEGIIGCGGSNSDSEDLTGLVEHGVPLEKDFPYTTEDPGEGNHHWDAPRTTFTDWHRIPPNDIETMKRVIHRFGALNANVLEGASFKEYETGIFTDGTTRITAPLPYYSEVNHRISIVGWNDNPEGGMGYWQLRNSWRDRWGEDGYMNISFTSANVALESTYLTLGQWSGENIDYVNTGFHKAKPWAAGGGMNDHGDNGTYKASAFARGRADKLGYSFFTNYNKINPYTEYELYGGVDNIFDEAVDKALGTNVGPVVFAGKRLNF